MYALIKSNDGECPLVLLATADEVLDAPDEYGVSEFRNQAFLEQNPDPDYWAEGDAVLVKLEVLSPKPVTSKWSLS